MLCGFTTSSGLSAYGFSIALINETGKLFPGENIQQEFPSIFGHIVHLVKMKFAAAWQKRVRPVEMQQSRGADRQESQKYPLFEQENLQNEQAPAFRRACPRKYFLWKMNGKIAETSQGKKEKKRCPALAVGTQLKPARDGRWVASVMLHAPFFQPEGPGGRDHTTRPASRLKNVGLKVSISTHRAGRTLFHAVAVLFKMLCRGLGYSSSSSEKSSFMNSL